MCCDPFRISLRHVDAGADRGGAHVHRVKRFLRIFEARDLKPTTDLRSVIKGVLQGQFGLSDRVLAETVFPDSASARPMKGLVT